VIVAFLGDQNAERQLQISTPRQDRSGPRRGSAEPQWSAVQLHDDAAAGSTTTRAHVGHPYTEVVFKDRRIG
jgi:hypothetical protein